MRTPASTVYFASAVPERMDRDLTLPARFKRLLERLPLAARAKGRRVAVKMHLGGGLGYSTIPPLFVRTVVDHLKQAGARSVFVTDGYFRRPEDRGYTPETLGAPLVQAFGADGKGWAARRTGWKPLPVAQLSRAVLEAELLVNLSHVKGHGDCGFGGAIKNLAMGCATSKTRAAIHVLEGELRWDRARCVRCGKCIEECPTRANRFNKKGEYEIFWHHCRMCRHCMLICPRDAIVIPKREFDLFQEGLARVARLVLSAFAPDRAFHINVLTQITIFCDCWGMTTPSLVPDVGIYASEDIVAVETASLRAIRTRNLIPGAITPPYRLGRGGHLFERIHHRDPFAQVRSMEALGAGSARHRVAEVK